MTIEKKGVPSASYGILQRNYPNSNLEEAEEQVRALGYAIINSGYVESELKDISEEFDRAWETYVETYGETELKRLGEFHTIRALLTHGGKSFLRLALNQNLLAILQKLIQGKYILNQQNGIINPPRELYSQGAWHRDLPYQHFVSSNPLAINALFCIDDFTFENGATFVLPGSHKVNAFPSEHYVRSNAIQVKANAGSFILLDCMMFHAGGFNSTNTARRAVNHVFNIPYFKQQINIPMNLGGSAFSDREREILGFNNIEPPSISAYLSTRVRE